MLGRPARAIGSQIYDSKIYLETPDLFAWTLVVILLSVLLELPCRALCQMGGETIDEGAPMKLSHITARYGELPILENFSLELPDSGVICFFAPSGTGKTTLLNLLCGLLQPDSGSITGLEDRRFAFVFQEDRLIPSLSARDNVGLVLDWEHQELARALTWPTSIYPVGRMRCRRSFPAGCSAG